jgi:CheY-like chemotaxis protein
MKKILLVDDQKLVLLSLEKCLTDLGYDVQSTNNVYDAIALYDSYSPDLVIADINMPVLPGFDLSMQTINVNDKASGLEVVKYIKRIRKHATAVMILSGNTEEAIINKGFELGVDDYMKKPVSLSEIASRVKRLIGGAGAFTAQVANTNRYIQKGCVGVVIPCYNEEERLLGGEFKTFVHKNLGYHLCFVNDGSKDDTLAVLEELRKGKEDYISIINCEDNGGKAEAVRLGMLHLAAQNQYDYIGFLDADLSTNFDDFQDLVTTIAASDFKIVGGSRMNRMGATIAKGTTRLLVSKTINFIIRKTLRMDINDTQCGAKVMTVDVINRTFQTKFLTKWLFDVEIFMRMKKSYGLEIAKLSICEQPLKRWIHADGSKLSIKDSIKIVGQIGQIALQYK